MKKQLFKRHLAALVLCFVLLSSSGFSETRASSSSQSVDIPTLVGQTLAVFSEHYIDTDANDYVVSIIKHRLAQGQYNHIATLNDFAETVGRDIRDVSGDVHLSLMVQDPDEPLTHILPTKEGRLSYNHAFEEVRYIYGNIGYLKFNKFHPSEEALATADTAFTFLQKSDGLIIDLRDTIGGSPYLVQHMLSYFFETDTVLWRVATRHQNDIDVIKVETIPSHTRFFKDFPIWLLTSPTTASASELFAGVLQSYGKAKVIGSTTAGAGYYVGVRKITDELTFRISLAKPTLPVSRKSWEKVGIKPDVGTDPVDAFDIAFSLALGAQ